MSRPLLRVIPAPAASNTRISLTCPNTRGDSERVVRATRVCDACNNSSTMKSPGTTASLCDQCSYLQQGRELKKLGCELEMVQFLRPQKQLDNEPADGFLKGDVRKVVQGSSSREHLFADKFVLCRRSVFCKIFSTSSCKLSLEELGTICFYDAPLEAMKAVIKLCYDAEVEFTDEVTAEEVVEVAQKYEIASLRKLCEENMIATISCENLPKRLMVAKKLELKGLEAAAVQFFKDHFDKVIKNVLAEIF